MTKNIFFLTILLFVSNAPSIHAKHIIVGSIEDMLFEADVLKTIKQLGIKGMFSNIGSFFKSIGNDKSAEEIATEKFLNSLKKVTVTKRQGPYPALPWRGLTPPPIVYEWLYGVSPSSILFTIKKQTKKSVYKLAKVSFDPVQNTLIMKPCHSMINVLKKLRNNGHTIHLMANWNDRCFKQLMLKNKQLFESIFNGEIIISGDIKKIITAKDIPAMLEEINIDPSDAVFMFIQPVHVQDLDTIHCPHNKTRTTENILKNKGLL